MSPGMYRQRAGERLLLARPHSLNLRRVGFSCKQSAAWLPRPWRRWLSQGPGGKLSRMQRLQAHLRNKLLAGALAAGPIVLLIWGAFWLEENTRLLTTPLGFHFPGLGVVMAVVSVYLLGLMVTSVLGQIALSFADRALRRVPGLNLLYQAWRDVLVVPTSKEGTFHRVVLVPGPGGVGTRLGFTSGDSLPGEPTTCCVFIPGAPNPLSGTLVLVDRDSCRPLDLSLEEAFKFLLSTGNYVPPGLQGLSSPPAEVVKRRSEEG
jgi:uncharacterized membrane protein